MAEEPADLFVSCVDGQPVTRAGSRVMIGADRTADGVTYRPDDIVMIPEAEWTRYRREYSRQLADGALVKRKREDWIAQEQLVQEAQDQAERAKAARKAAREAAPTKPSEE